MRRVGWLGVLLALGSAACARCTGARPADRAPGLERLLPRGAVAVLVVPSLAGLGERVALLERLKVAGFLAPTQGFADAHAFADALVAELGVDLRSPEALSRAGLDGTRAAGAVALATGQIVLALPVADPARFQQALEVLAAARLGAGVRATHAVDGVEVRTFAGQAAAAPGLGYVLAHGWALLATGDAVERLPALARLGEADALSTDPVLAARLARRDGPSDAWAWLPTGSPLLAGLPFQSALVSAALSADGLRVGFDADPKPAARPQVEALQRKPGEDLTGLLPKDAFLIARGNADPALLAPVALALAPFVARAFEDADVDLASLLGQLKPGVVAALSLADRPPLGQGLPALDLGRTNPFRYAHLSGVAVARSASAVLPALDQVALVAPRFGATLKRTERGGVPVYLGSWSQGEGVHVAVSGDRVLFGSPLPRVEALLEGGDGGVALPPAGDEAVVVRVDLRRLAQSVRTLPESAWGLGGFALKGTTVRWLDATDDLLAITASARARDGALQGTLTLSLALAAPAP